MYAVQAEVERLASGGCEVRLPASLTQRHSPCCGAVLIVRPVHQGCPDGARRRVLLAGPPAPLHRPSRAPG
jgi:hypothetical protein